MSTVNGAEAAVRSLQLHGVKHVFGLCGDTSLPFYDALARLDHGIEHILTRDERHAGYMADAYARVTGRVGVCEGPSGGGATYILEANESSVTALDQKALFAPLTKWNAVADEVGQIPHLFRTAFRAATTGRPGATHIGLPYDLQKQSLDAGDLWALPEHASFPAFRTAPDPDAVRACAEVLLRARRPAFICGGGVIISGASAELVALAEALDAAVASTVSGRDPRGQSTRDP